MLGAGLRFSEPYKGTVRKIEGPCNKADGVFLLANGYFFQSRMVIVLFFSLTSNFNFC